MPAPGEIYLHHSFYQDSAGQMLPKYLLILANDPSGDFIFRLLTSRQNNRPTEPLCFHGDPYPGFYIGVIGGPLSKDTWVDLRQMDDYEQQIFTWDLGAGEIAYISTIDNETMCSILDCVANANDTTGRQRRSLVDQRATFSS